MRNRVFNQPLRKQAILARLPPGPRSAVSSIPQTQAEENCKTRWVAFPSLIFIRCSSAARLANYPTIHTGTVYPAIFLPPSPPPSPTSQHSFFTFSFYLSSFFFTPSYTLKHGHTRAARPPARVIHKHSFLSRFLFIDPPQPLLSIRLSSSVFVQVSIHISLSLPPVPFSLFPSAVPLFLHFQSTTERLFRVMHRFVSSSPL